MGDYVDRGKKKPIQDITVSRQSHFSLLSRSDTKIELPSWEEIINLGKSHRSMDSMTNVAANMAIRMSGNASQNYLITFP